MKIIISMLLSFLVATVAFAAINDEESRNKAASTIPAGAKHLYTKAQAMEYEVQFINETTNVHYDIKVSKVTGNVTEFKSRTRGHSGSRTVNISESGAKNIVLRDFPQAVIQSVLLSDNGGYKKYVVSFTAGSIRGVFGIDPDGGAVIEKTLIY